MNYIFVHGLGQTASSWDDTLQVINRDRDIFCPKLSDWFCGRETSYDILYESFEKYCDEFDDMLCLVGISLGGILAMQYTIEHPEKVKSLVLIGTQFRMPKGLLTLQNALFYLIPNYVFEKKGFQKSNFIKLCKSMRDLDFSQHLKDIGCEVLIICGEKDKANKSASSQLAKLIPKTKDITITGAGHEVNIDCPTSLGKELEIFFK